MKLIWIEMAEKLLMSKLHLYLELIHKVTCRTLRLEIGAKPLMILFSSLIKACRNLLRLTVEASYGHKNQSILEFGHFQKFAEKFNSMCDVEVSM